MSATTKVKKTVDLELVGLDGNAYALLGAFRRQAKKEGWTKEEIDAVTDEATSGDYDNLLRVLVEHCEPTDDCEDCDEEDDEDC